MKFEIEKPESTSSGLSLSLLDFKVTISKDGNSSFEFYKKPAKKPLFVHRQSAIPAKSKLNFIHNERKRIKDRCSSSISAKQHLNTFDDNLRLNGYTENTIEKTKHPQNPQQNRQPGNTEWSYLKIPYISERLNHKITNIFRKENILVCIAHKSHTLRQALSHTSTERKYTRDNALSLTPDYVYKEMQCTSSHATAAINNILVASHASFTTAQENIFTMKIPLLKNTSIPARTKTIKAFMPRLLCAKTTPLIYTSMKLSTSEYTSPHSIPEKNVLNSQTFYFNILF